MPFDAIRKSHKRFDSQNCDNLALRIEKLNPVIDDWMKKEHQAKDNGLDAMENFRFPSASAKAYHQSFFKWKSAVSATGDCEIFEIEALTRVLLGTGNASVFEFGFQLNYPWGVPYISGSSLKGLVSSYMARHGGSVWARHKDRIAVKSDAQTELFGGIRDSGGENGQSYAGTLVFHDAWLAPPKKPREKDRGDWFDPDIITPHYTDYYNGKEILPHGMNDPVPIKMAALCPGLSFLVVIQGPESYRNLARDVLLQALKEEGIGGKRAVGYGRFAYVPSEDERNEEHRRAIENATDPETLQHLYQQNKTIKSLRQVFVAAVERLGYTNTPQGMLESLMPLTFLKMLVEKKEIADLNSLNKRYKGLKNQISGWQKAVNIEALNRTTEGRALFDLMLAQWPDDIKGGAELGVVKALAYEWEDLGLTDDEILEIIDGKERIWPRLEDITTFLAQRRATFDADTFELICLALEQKGISVPDT